MEKSEEVFVRRASGLSRVMGPWDSLIFAFVNPVIPYAFHYLIWSQALYPGADTYVSSLFILTMVPINLLYFILCVAMPRSGGEYVWGSRILHPAVGFVISFAAMILGLYCAGTVCQWSTMWGLGDGIYMEGLRAGNQGLIDLGLNLQNPYTWTAYAINVLQIIFVFFIIWLGMKWINRFQWFAGIVTIIMLVCFMGIALTTNPAQVAARMQALQGLSYDQIIEQGTGLGYMPGLFSIAATSMAGLTYYNLSVGGVTYITTIAGEVKKVRKSQAMALFLSIIGFILFWQLFSFSIFRGLGREFVESIGFLNAAGVDAAAFNKVAPPVGYFFTLYMTGNPILMQLAGPASLIIVGLAGMMGWSAAGTRYFFAWAFDGLLPEWVCALDRKGRAWGATLLGLIVVLFINHVNTWAPQWLAYLAMIIPLWFITFFILGIGAVIFHRRRKDIYDVSPALVRTRLAGIPVTAIAGVLCMIFAVMVIYSTLYPAFTGEAVGLSATYLTAIIVISVVFPLIYYAIVVTYRKAKGVPMDLRFKEIPPD